MKKNIIFEKNITVDGAEQLAGRVTIHQDSIESSRLKYDFYVESLYLGNRFFGKEELGFSLEADDQVETINPLESLPKFKSPIEYSLVKLFYPGSDYINLTGLMLAIATEPIQIEIVEVNSAGDIVGQPTESEFLPGDLISVEGDVLYKFKLGKQELILAEFSNPTVILDYYKLKQIRDHLSKGKNAFSVYKFNPTTYFRYSKGTNVDALELTNVSIYSTTYQQEALQIVDWIKAWAQDNIRKARITITDATSNIGGDAIAFAQAGWNVNAVEIDPLIFSALQNNVNVFELNNKITLYNDNYVLLGEKLEQDIIYIDAPWSGVTYNAAQSIVLKLDDVPITDLINYLLPEGQAKLIVLKVPLNVDLSEIDLEIKTEKKDIKRKDKLTYQIVLCYL